MAANPLWLLAAALIVAHVVTAVPEDSVQSLDDTSPAESQVSSWPWGAAFIDEDGGSRDGQMSPEMLHQARHAVVKMAGELKSPSLQMDALAASRLASRVLGEAHNDNDKGEGLKLIFRKLDELEKKINSEEEIEAATESDSIDSCTKEIQRLNDGISEASSKRSNNQLTISGDSNKIEENRALWVESRAAEDRVHESLVAMQQQRAEDTEAVHARVDERNKAIDVLTKATFMVCERFGRYKETPQCHDIKSTPDVDEPQRYKTKPFEKAQHDTKKLHEKGGTWDLKWQEQMKKDEKLEGNPDPQGTRGGISHNQAEASNATDTEPETEQARLEGELRQAANRKLLSVQEQKQYLSQEEKVAVNALYKLSKTKGLKRKYSLPLAELAISLREGQAKRSKSIVEILLQVLKETTKAQADDKAQHTYKLAEYYGQSWDMKKVLDSHARKQAELRAEMEEKRLHIKEVTVQNEEERKNQLSGHAARTQEEDRCSQSSEEYGVRSAYRGEDLENLVKLKSLLRSLYFKKFPKACRRHKSAVCGGPDRGWCVYTKRDPENTEQRCSCMVGYYGPACEYVMCPGIGKTLYKAGAAGSCSNRGQCDDSTGLCHCSAAYYHGPKQACDYKYAPPSKNNPIPDNRCSDSGTYDPIRGVCNCRIESFGPGCEEKKCPNSNGVLYPRSSGNSCNGRGPCDIDTGKCGCPVVKEACGKACAADECSDAKRCGSPYFGTSCEFERCPRDCSNRGQCDNMKGHCACDQGFFGPACEFRTCPKDCSGGGECNRNDGKCICKDGYSGFACDKTIRCTAEGLHNDEMNWWTIWDKPGWMVCPKGQMMYSIKRSLCQALSCIDSGGCAAACEGDNHIYQLRHCYHDLRWYTSFDTAGVSSCLDDYFVAGLFRSCESLYCLNMAKCCSLKEARWTQCKWHNWAKFNNPTTAAVGDNQFIVGFKRGEGHQLKDIDEAKGCGFVRGY